VDCGGWRGFEKGKIDGVEEHTKAAETRFPVARTTLLQKLSARHKISQNVDGGMPRAGDDDAQDN